MKCKALFLLLFLPLCSVAQNLVPNGSFEEYEECPNVSDNMNQASGWWSSRESCDYYNACGLMGVPHNHNGYQYAIDGNAYAGYVSTYSGDFAEAREHLMTELIHPLQVGVKYYVSFYVATGRPNFGGKASNNQGALFTLDPYYAGLEETPIDNFAHINNLTLIDDTVFWHQVKGSFIADNSYTYVAIGNFFNQANTQIVNLSNLDAGGSYYYVDEVRVSTDSSYVFEPLYIANIDLATFQVFPNPFLGNLTVSTRKSNLVSTKVYDSMGQLVYINTRLNKKIINIDLSYLNTGLYFLEVISENGQNKIFRIVKRE